jgi:hypothetical protein
VKLTKQLVKVMIERKVIELLKLGKSRRAIARELKIGTRKVKAIQERGEAEGALSKDSVLPRFPESPLKPEPTSPRKKSEFEIEFLGQIDWIQEKKKKGWHTVTIWEQLPKPLKRSTFYRLMRLHGLDTPRKKEATPEIIHQPGEALLLDWGKLCNARHPVTGKSQTVWAFAGVLGFSRKRFVRLVWSNSTVETLRALESILEEAGGVPQRITSDNPKCFAIKACKYEPILNPAIELFASHYGTRMECLPPREPEKKGKIERVIPFLRRLFESHDEWVSIEESEEYLRKQLEMANERVHGSTRQKPTQQFEEIESMALKSLPSISFQHIEVAAPKVRADSHVRFKDKYYSVDPSHTGKESFVVGSLKDVRIFIDGQLVETHDRIVCPNQFKSTKPKHMKSKARALRDNAHYLQEAQKVGPNCRILIGRILQENHGFIEFRMVWGILGLSKKFENKDIDDACQVAMTHSVFSYRFVHDLLEGTSTPKIQEPKPTESYVRNIRDYVELVASKQKGTQENDNAIAYPPSPTQSSQASNCLEGAGESSKEESTNRGPSVAHRTV